MKIKEKNLTLIIGVFLTVALACTTLVNILTDKKNKLEGELSERKMEMIIESSSANMYDARVSTRSIENILYNSFPSSREAIQKLLEKINKTPNIRYEDELLDYAKKRDIHAERFNKIVDELNELEPKTEKKIEILGVWNVILRFLEIFCISAALILNTILLFYRKYSGEIIRITK